MKKLITLVALTSTLMACGGGGDPAVPDETIGAYDKPAVSLRKSNKPNAPINTGCHFVTLNHVDCDLVPSSGPIGTGIPPGVYLTLTNRTGGYLQIDEAEAFTGEQAIWSEFCIYLNYFQTAQNPAGQGEVGCSAKSIGNDYTPISFGAGTGLSVAPGGVVYLSSSADPVTVNHTYSLSVRSQSTGLHVWRQPAVDQVFLCDGQIQSTAMSPFTNTSGRTMFLTGVSIYSESGNSQSLNQLNGAACIYVLDQTGSIRYQNCDANLRSKGDMTIPTVTIEPGEQIAAQAVNSCAAPARWGWAAFLRVF